MVYFVIIMTALISGWWLNHKLTKKTEKLRSDIINNSNGCNDLDIQISNLVSNLEEKIQELKLNESYLLNVLDHKLEIKINSLLNDIDKSNNKIIEDVKEKIKQLNETADKLSKDYEKKDLKNDSLLFKKFFKSPTPANFAEIMALWPYLSDESKIIFFLETSNKEDFSCLVHLMNELCILALKSPNPYIRYLAAKEYMFDFKTSQHLDNEAQSIIKQDSHHLVKYLHLEDNYSYSCWGPEEKDFKTLLQLDHQAKLAIVKSGGMNGERFADLISYFCLEGLPANKISEMEIFEIVYTYIFGRFIWPYPHSLEELEKLWKLIPVVPERISWPLIEKLSAQDHYHCESIPDEVLEHMNKLQITQLLSRSDVYLQEFRKKLFHQICNDSETYFSFDSFLSAIVSHHFDLKIFPCFIPGESEFKDEFLQILQLPKNKSLEILFSLLVGSKDCRPVILLASGDYLSYQNFNDDCWLTCFRYKKKMIRDDIENGTIDEYDVRDLQLYTLAKRIMPWGKEKPESENFIDTDDLRFLLSHIKWGKTWETFQSIRDAWYSEYGTYKDNLLPRPKLY